MHVSGLDQAVPHVFHVSQGFQTPAKWSVIIASTCKHSRALHQSPRLPSIKTLRIRDRFQSLGSPVSRVCSISGNLHRSVIIASTCKHSRALHQSPRLPSIKTLKIRDRFQSLGSPRRSCFKDLFYFWQLTQIGIKPICDRALN
jgi:hypothetical protein